MIGRRAVPAYRAATRVDRCRVPEPIGGRGAAIAAGAAEPSAFRRGCRTPRRTVQALRSVRLGQRRDWGPPRRPAEPRRQVPCSARRSGRCRRRFLRSAEGLRRIRRTGSTDDLSQGRGAAEVPTRARSPARWLTSRPARPIVVRPIASGRLTTSRVEPKTAMRRRQPRSSKVSGVARARRRSRGAVAAWAARWWRPRRSDKIPVERRARRRRRRPASRRGPLGFV